MNQRILSWSPEVIATAVKIINSSGIIVYPTDTLYGFGGKASDKTAVDKINLIKNRKAPISVIVSDLQMAFSISDLTDKEKDIFIKHFGGENTIIVKARKGELFPQILGPDGSVGIRMPDHPLGKELVKTLNCPITTTSVNRTGEQPLNDPDEIMKQFRNEIDLLIDEGVLPQSKGSSIYKLKNTTLSKIR